MVWKADQVSNQALSDAGYDLDSQGVVGGSYGSAVVLKGTR